jgi:hypothetical protein
MSHRITCMAHSQGAEALVGRRGTGDRSQAERDGEAAAGHGAHGPCPASVRRRFDVLWTSGACDVWVEQRMHEEREAQRRILAELTALENCSFVALLSL